MSGKPSFFSELTQCLQGCDRLLVGGWALAQDLSVSGFRRLNFAIRLIVLFIIIGFPVALAAAWFFEITPE